MTVLTDIRACHEEHGDVSTGDGSGGGPDDVRDDRAAHGDGEVEEPFPGSICGYQMGNGHYACGSNLSGGRRAPACQALRQPRTVTRIQGGLSVSRMSARACGTR